MKRFFVTLVVAFSFFGINLAHAEGKVATVSLQRALNEVEEGKKAKSSLEADFSAKQKEIESLKTELKTMRDNLEKQKMVLSEEALKTKTNEMQTKLMSLQQKASDYEQQLKQKEADSADKILGNLKLTLISLAKKSGYDMVYENSAGMILYAPNAPDITDDLIKTYNSQPIKK